MSKRILRKSLAIFTALSIIISCLPYLSVGVFASYSSGDSFIIYSLPGCSGNTAGRSYIWNVSPDAKVTSPGNSEAMAQFFKSGDGIVHEPAAGSLNGLNTDIVINHRCSTVNDSDLAAVVTYVENGVTKYSPAFRFTGFHYNARQNSDLGAPGTRLDFDIGTYPNVVSVNVYHILSEVIDSSNSGIGGVASQPYHEYVKFTVTGAAGTPIIPTDKYYIETNILPAQELGKPIATPVPTPQEPTIPGPTPEPVVAPAPLATDAPVVALGLGANFTLYPHNEKSISAPSDFVLGDYGVVTTPSVGPYTVPNAANELNFDNGISRIDIAANGKIIGSNPDASFGRYGVRVSGAVGNKITYIPKAGLLTGVVTEISVVQTYYANSSGLDAVITYDGGKTATVNYLPDKGVTKNNPDMDIIKIGQYPNIESVAIVTRGTGAQFLPPVIFTVVNENPDEEAPASTEIKYERPFIPTVAPTTVSLLPVPNVTSPISINEICSSNKTGYKDQFGKYSDWIELYNNSTAAVDISGYKLTDDVTVPNKWTFPSGSVVPAGGYLIVAASGNNTVINGEIHTNFSISANGERIMLSDSNSGVIDIIDLPALGTDTTFSRCPDGSNDFKVTNPTVGASNNNASTAKIYLPKPEFSADSGFYKDPFNLTIKATNTTTGNIYYTTDGSTPTKDSNLYSATLSIVNRTSEPNGISAITYPSSTYIPTVKIQKSMIVRAAVIDDQGNSSEVVTKSYFVGYDMANDFNNMMVISMSTNANGLFDSGYGIFPNYAEQRREFERRVHLDIFDSDGSLVINQDAGTRVRAYGFKGEPQKGLNFYARGDYGAKRFNYPLFGDKAKSNLDGSTIKSFDTFALRHGSYNYGGLRYMDGCAQFLSADLGTGYQAQRPAVLFINGEYWGIYYMSEKVSNDYVESHYGVPAENQILIKNHLNTGTATEADRQMYVNMVQWLGSTDFSIQANYDKLTRDFDLDNLMKYWATNIDTTNRDWQGYNFVVWRSRDITSDPYHDGKWRFLLYDMDTSYISAPDEVMPAQLQQSFAHAVISNPSLKRVFLNVLLDAYNNEFDPQRAYNVIGYWFNEMMPTFLPQMKDRWGSDFNYVSGSLGGKYSAVFIREKYWLNYLRQVFGLTGVYTNLNVRVNDNRGGTVKINSMNHDFTKGSYSTRNFTDYTSSLVATPNDGYRFTGWTKTYGTSLSSDTDTTTYVTLSPNGSMVQANFERIPTETVNISTAQDLVNASNSINSDPVCAKKQYVLLNDIDLSGISFTPIGTAANPFLGIFDGGNYTINGLSITSDNIQGSGLFGYVGASGIIKNAGVTNVNIVSTGTDGKNVGGIAGNNAGLIENCYTTGSLSGVSTVGGIVGSNNNNGSVNNCYSIATVNSDSLTTLGGIAGKTETGGAILNCYSLITPVAKNDGGTVGTLTAQKTAEELASGEVAYLLNNNGKKSVWGNSQDGPILATDINKPITIKVTFYDGNSYEYAYTFNGGTVALPDTSVNWYNDEDKTSFTSTTVLTGNATVVKEGVVIPTASPTPSPTVTPSSTPSPSSTPKPSVSPTPIPTPPSSGEPYKVGDSFSMYARDIYSNTGKNDSYGYSRAIDIDANGNEVYYSSADQHFGGGEWTFKDQNGNDKSCNIYTGASKLGQGALYVLNDRAKGFNTKVIANIIPDYQKGCWSAIVTYDGGKTTAPILVYDSKQHTVINGVSYDSWGYTFEKELGTWPNVESVKFYMSDNGYWGTYGIFPYQATFSIESALDSITAINIADNKVSSVEISSNGNTSGSLVIATYDSNDTLNGIKIVPVTDIDYANGTATMPVNLVLPTGTVRVKAFLLNTLSNIKPLINSLSKEL